MKLKKIEVPEFSYPGPNADFRYSWTSYRYWFTCKERLENCRNGDSVVNGDSDANCEYDKQFFIITNKHKTVADWSILENLKHINKIERKFGYKKTVLKEMKVKYTSSNPGKYAPWYKMYLVTPNPKWLENSLPAGLLYEILRGNSGVIAYSNYFLQNLLKHGFKFLKPWRNEDSYLCYEWNRDCENWFHYLKDKENRNLHGSKWDYIENDYFFDGIKKSYLYKLIRR